MTSHAEIVAVTNRLLRKIFLYPVPGPSETFLYRCLFNPKEPTVVQSDDGAAGPISGPKPTTCEILGHADTLGPLRAYRAECEEAMRHEAEFRLQAEVSTEASRRRAIDLANRISELDASIAKLEPAPPTTSPAAPSSPQTEPSSPGRAWLSDAAQNRVRDSLSRDGAAVRVPPYAVQIVADTLREIALQQGVTGDMIGAGLDRASTPLSPGTIVEIYRATRALERL